MTLPTPYYERDGITIYVGDNREVLPHIGPVHAVVTDPPSGISFMGKEWDSNKGGRDQWIAWLAETLSGVSDAMLPGAHALIWALPRTSGWTSMAIEDAGMDVRDCITHLFGSGFPKSHNVANSIDKMHGHPNRGRAIPTASTHLPNGRYATEKLTGNKVPPYEARTPEAEQWQGWGTALKPAAEFWYLARKPFKGNVAANVLAHGTGAINIDASRIGPDGGTTRGANRSNSGKARNTLHGGNFGIEPIDKGRWPANVILDEEAAAMLDAQSGERKSGGGQKTTAGVKPQAPGGWPESPRLAGPTYAGDTGGASRFFKVVAQDAECLACARTHEPKHDIMRATERVAPCDHASSAKTSSPLTDQDSGSAHDPAPARLPLENGGSSQSSNGRASTAVSSSGSTQPTRTPIAVDNALDSLVESLVPRVRSAASLCDSCVTAIAQSLAATLLGQTPESHHGLDSIPGSNASILIRNLASYAEPMVNTGIIPTTASLSTLFGSVQHAIDANTSKALGAPSTAYAPTRFLYQSKASRRERNAGLEGMPERGGAAGELTARGNTNPVCRTCGGSRIDRGRGVCKCAAPEWNAVNLPQQNHHPTVKPLALMRYLIQMITPPGGVILDPFAGSGSTLVAAAQLGFHAIGIELSEEYAEIAARRVDHALNERAKRLPGLEVVS